jgi:hypothetical protein
VLGAVSGLATAFVRRASLVGEAFDSVSELVGCGHGYFLFPPKLKPNPVFRRRRLVNANSRLVE